MRAASEYRTYQFSKMDFESGKLKEELNYAGAAGFAVILAWTDKYFSYYVMEKRSGNCSQFLPETVENPRG